MFPLFLDVGIEDETIVYSRDSDFRSPWDVKRYVKKVSKDLSKKRKKFNKLKEEVGYTFAKSKLGYDPNKIDFDLEEEKREILQEYISKARSELCQKGSSLGTERDILRKSISDLSVDWKLWKLKKYKKKEKILRELESALRS